jgi:uncharacterized protein
MTRRERRDGPPPDDPPLVWNVAGLLGEPSGSHRDYAFDGVEIDLGEELRLASPISGRVHLARTNRGLLVDADASTTLAEECARCLRDIEVPVTVEFETEALPSIDLQTGSPVRLAPEDADEDVIILSDHHELDLERSIREAILLAEPIAPLCREDCPGLCPICGERLEDGDHDHPDEDIDPRLEALKAFRPAAD